MRYSIYSMAILACGAASILTLGHDAGAETPSSSVPNLNYAHAGTVAKGAGLSMVQLGFSPFLAISKAISAPSTGEPADAEFLQRGWGSAPEVKAIVPHSFAPADKDNLYKLTERHDLMDYYPGATRASGANDLKFNAFQAPWHLPKTQFDPRFRTPYWNEEQGFTNASFQRVLGRTEAAEEMYNGGLYRAGKHNFAANQPVWDNKHGDATSALFPQTTGGASASAAL